MMIFCQIIFFLFTSLFWKNRVITAYENKYSFIFGVELTKTKKNNCFLAYRQMPKSNKKKIHTSYKQTNKQTKEKMQATTKI